MGDMFVNTKMDFGPCEKVHSDELKEEFLKSSDHSIFDGEVERDFTQRISDIDRTIRVCISNHPDSSAKVNGNNWKFRDRGQE